MAYHSIKPLASPPETSFADFLIGSEPGALGQILSAGTDDLRAGRYDHWEKFRRRRTPAGLTSEQWWAGVKLARAANRRQIPLADADGTPFSFTLADPLPETLSLIDRSLGGQIGIPDRILNSDQRDTYVVSSLIDEAITSSQIEGAAVTRDVAQKMLRTRRRPKDEGEQMILNNFNTMRYIKTLGEEPLSRELLEDLHRRMTEGTLDDPADAGRVRAAGREIVVEDVYGNVTHRPPPAGSLGERIEALCRFANGDDDERFIHPAVRAMAIHFWLAYDHPFADGNGRTARALFYWSMLRSGYWLFEFISISQVIAHRDFNKAYYRAYLQTESDENDLTYFLLYHCRVIRRAIDDLHGFIERKAKQAQAVDGLLQSSSGLNHRQRALLGHAMRHPVTRYTTENHQGSHAVAYQTARNDLTDLESRGLMTRERIGRVDHFSVVQDFEDRLSRLR